jgi:hypothetical protein
MVCEHLQKLYQLCLDQKIRLSASDLIHVVCHQCGRQDVCPSNLRDDHDDEPTVQATKRTEQRTGT